MYKRIAILLCSLLLVLATGCTSTTSSSSAASTSTSSSNTSSSKSSSASSSSSSSSTSSSNSSSSNSSVAAFDPNKTYEQGDMAKFSGYSLGGQQTVDNNTGKNGAVIYFSTNKNASASNAQCIILLDTVRGLTAGTSISLTGVYTNDADGTPVFVEL